MILKLGVRHLGMELYKVNINHNPDLCLRKYFGPMGLSAPASGLYTCI